MTARNWIGTSVICTMLLALFVSGCSNKGGRAGKVDVVLSDRAKEKGISLVDWRYSNSEKSFGVKLKTSSTVEKQTYLVISGPGISRVKSLSPSAESINKGEWIDYGGSKALGNPFEHFPESGTITIDVE